MTNGERRRPTVRPKWLYAAMVGVTVLVVAVGLKRIGDSDAGFRATSSSDTRGVTANPRPLAGRTVGSSASPSTSTSAAAPASGERSETDEYRARVVQCNGEISQQLDALMVHLVKAQYGNTDWTNETTAILVGMAATADEARRIRPTPEYEESHSVWLEGIESYDWVAENMVLAIRGPDEALMTRCSDRLAAASARFREAAALMGRVTTK